ncbi:sodium-independent sulfate anion transporter isoform X2 [Plutella xylostella]|uniref:sodium-independent sulfate anion transporter isoform X1 n=1 Tax=Plutella xylostella TaxID=51655 RepID=UPI002032DA95|nr:sodium-independent sulfate anion transporter isoform X1 [Plutella xylostella]XP_048482805.1 sodium-independent sulfate anion transporter isoform X2 [Plutella xylostella]
MENGENDPRRPLLGGPSGRRSKFGLALRGAARRLCSSGSWRRRLPISIWLPNYSLAFLLQDAIAGITVGLTSIPQGIAYAIIAGVPPQVGLYSSSFPGLVYVIFGSCSVVTVGPTAILAALLSKYVAYNVDFAYLAAFLSGCVILLLGVLQLGFLLDFISKPVISGFTTAAALQIAAAQLKSLFRISGKSGNTFIDAIKNFIKNIETVQLWDTVLGFCTIIALLILKKATPTAPPANDTSSRACVVKTWQYIVRARNALVVAVGAVVAYCFYLHQYVPFALTGKIEGGLPRFGPPPFTTTVGNQTLGFEDMLSVFGPEGLVMPLVAILESIAIAKAFAGTSSVDNSQEMIAVGMCNLLASFCQSMPATGSFTRTALNHASGVATPAGSFFKATLVLLSVTLMSRTFYFIPRATLAGVIVVAMASLMDLAIVRQLWRNSKLELLVYLATVATGLGAGLEYGILAGAAADVLRLLLRAARPTLPHRRYQVGNQECLSLLLVGHLSYSCSEYMTEKIKKYVLAQPMCVILDGRHLYSIDIGVAENIISVILDVEKSGHRVLFWNFAPDLQKLIEDLNPSFSKKFVTGSSIDQHILGTDGQLNTLITS